MNRQTQQYKEAMSSIRGGVHAPALRRLLERNLGLNVTTKAREATGKLSDEEIAALIVIRAIMEGSDD